MRKFLSITFALLLIVSIAGVAYSHSLSYNPKDTTDGGNYITAPVYNNTTALDVGDVVVWDIDSSTGDNDMYVTTTTTAETGLVAGVVYPSAIAAGAEGTIVIWGMAECDVNSSGAAVSAPLCSSTTAGAGKTCATAGAGQYAITTATIGASAQGNCFVDLR